METRDPVNILSVGLLSGAVVLLAFFAAGMFPHVSCAVSLLLAATYAFVERRARQRNGASSPPPVRRACAALVLFFLITLIALPARLSILTGGPRYRQNMRVVEALDTAAELGMTKPMYSTFCLSRNRAGTMRRTALFIGAFCALLLAATLSPRARIRYLRIASAIGLIVAVGGYLGQWRIPQGDTLWWVFPVLPYLPGPVACFMNPNLFGGFVAMMIPIPLALAFHDLERKRWLACSAQLLSATVMAAAMAFSMSRGSLLAFSLGLIVLAVALFLLRRPLFGGSIVLLLAAALAGVVFFPNEAVRTRLLSLTRITTSDSYTTRLNVSIDTLRLWRRYPLTGVGLNGFRMTYPAARHTSHRASMHHAHNEVAQYPADAGLVGVVLAGWLAVAVWRAAVGGGRPREHMVLYAAGAGVFGVAAAHALYDSMFHIPLYATVFASVVGCCIPAHRSPDLPAAASTRPAGVPRSAAILVAGAVLLLPSMFTMQKRDSVSYIASAEAQEVGKALQWAPTSSVAWYELGRRAWMQDSMEAWRFGERCMTQAIVYDPNNYVLLRELGNIRLAVGDNTGAREAFTRVHELRSWIDIPDIPEDTQ